SCRSSIALAMGSGVTGELRWSGWATLALAASATPFVYATEIYPEVPAALILVAVLWALAFLE
ncbi:hypothetical protein, partial [Serratia marcescens]|uniref:hypothetical protein n=1 Tax=Serratia marcescens TaxID=615 RepID=UPI0013D92F1A